MSNDVDTTGSVSESCRDSGLYPGQWRLARVELANWGTFDGYHGFDVDRKGLLITGESGSGKSTILDAIATVLTPSGQLRLNAAAANGAARDHGRSISHYVRGAWGHSSAEGGELVHKFLRASGSTWSGIMLRYEAGVDPEVCGGASSSARRYEPVTLLAVFFQKGSTTTVKGLHKFFAVVRGRHKLSEFEPYARAEADMTRFNKEMRGKGQAWRDHASFEAHLCRVMGIESSKTLGLLHKAQAAKNIGSLDELFRRYMLEVPRTHELADEAVEQFEELARAHDGVVDQRRQMEVLSPLQGLDGEYSSAASSEKSNEGLKQKLQGFAALLTREAYERELSGIERDRVGLADAIRDATRASESAKRSLQTAQAMFNKQGGMVLESARKDVLQYEKDLRAVQNNRNALQREISRLGELWDSLPLKVPDTLQEFEGLKKALAELADKAKEKGDDRNSQRIGWAARLGECESRMRGIRKQLDFMGRRASNVPSDLSGIRDEIANNLGLMPSDLPFIAEMVDVKAEERRWQGAIERLMRGRAQTMLSDKRHASAIAAYLESRHLGRRFEFDAVPSKVEVPDKTFDPRSVVRKVSVVQMRNHENFSQWVNRMVRRSFDYVCVDDPEELSAHPFSLTVGGQVRKRDHYVKDDRYEVGNRTRWILGSSNDEKLEILQGELVDAVEEYGQAQDKLAALDAENDAARDMERMSDALAGQDWERYDGIRAEEDLRRARDHQRDLEESDRFKDAVKAKDEAEKEFGEAEKKRIELVENLRLKDRKVEELGGLIREQADKLQACEEEFGPIEPGQRLEFRTMFKDVDPGYASSALSVSEAKSSVQEMLDRNIRAAVAAQNDAKRKTELILQQYRTTWAAEAADFAEDFEGRKEYIARWNRIRMTGLPDFEKRFLDVLNDFSQDQITAISAEIRNAYREVRDRLEAVNRSLMLSEFAPGMHLQIDVKQARTQRVEEFLSDLGAIASGSWDGHDIDSAEERYRRTEKVMKRLGSADSADRQWRHACLNTPDHMKFVANELDADGSVVNVYGNDEGLSGGERQKLVFFCLAAALRYQLSDEDQPVPTYGTIVLDEAFDKSDRHFAREALDIFKAFNFHMVLASPGKLLQTTEDHIGAIVLVSCEDGKRSRLSTVAFEEDGTAR